MGFFPVQTIQAQLAGTTIPGSLTVAGLTDTGGITTSSGYSGTGVAGVSVPGNVDVTLAGDGLKVKEGANAKQGTAILSSGTILVPNTSVTATSRILCGLVTLGTVTVPSALGVSARTPGTSFTILASQATDTSTVWYEIFEPG